MNRFLLLGVNIDHVATLRNARKTIYPDPIQAAMIAEHAGADSITIHLREDRRHITERDVYLLRKVIQTKMNLEMAVKKEMLDIACKILPDYCCLVPENRMEITTESGLNVISNKPEITSMVRKLQSLGIRVSIFIDADEKQIFSAYETGVSHIELHTGPYANAKNEKEIKLELDKLYDATNYAKTLGLVVNAGHGLDYYNLPSMVSTIPHITELNIGHSIISRSLIVGLSQAVKDIKKIIIQSLK